MEESRLPAVFRVQGEQLVVSERRSDAYVPSQHTISRRIFQREKREVEDREGRGTRRDRGVSRRKRVGQREQGIVASGDRWSRRAKEMNRYERSEQNFGS